MLIFNHFDLVEGSMLVIQWRPPEVFSDDEKAVWEESDDLEI